MPLRISLVTPSFQQAGFLEECLRSVHQQHHEGIEHIVVDGGSSDGSADIIARWGPHLAWWCSEPDRGQAHAINKGLHRATGAVFNWLNSDDLLLPGSLTLVADAFSKDTARRIFGGHRLRQAPDGTRERLPLDDASKPDDLFIRPRIAQQSTFFRTADVRTVNGVEERLRYVMDLELWWQLLFRFGTEGIRFAPVDLAVFRIHPGSKTARVQARFVDETAGLLHRMCLQCGLTALAEVLAMAHDLPEDLRPFAIDPPRHRSIVQRMAWHFLLRWHHRIHSRRQFAAMRRFMDRCPPREDMLDDEQRAWLGLLRGELAVPGWWAYRLRRKWHHLVR